MYVALIVTIAQCHSLLDRIKNGLTHILYYYLNQMDWRDLPTTFAVIEYLININNQLINNGAFSPYKQFPYPFGRGK